MSVFTKNIRILYSLMMHELTAFQRDILYVIVGMGEPRGVAVKEELDKYYEDEIVYSRLYQNLNRLADMELIAKGQIDDRTNKYVITEEGTSALSEYQEWKEERLTESAVTADGGEAQ